MLFFPTLTSYQKEILHFSHEISIPVYLDNNKIELIEGYETGPEDSAYCSQDWNYLKTKHCISEESIINKINAFINKKTNNKTVAWDSSGAEGVAKQ